MARDEQEPTLDKWGAEVHPAFGHVSVHRVSAVGTVLFDSEIKHSTYMIMRISEATRKRDLNRDWIHGDSKIITEIAMSESQWSAMIASTNTGGVPCTLQYTQMDGVVPSLPYAPRMAQSLDEVRTAADRTMAAIKEARDAYEAKKTVANLRTLHFVIENAAANMEYAADSLTEHAENVVTKAKADIEATMTAHAQTLGLTAPQAAAIGREMLAIDSADESDEDAES